MAFGDGSRGALGVATGAVDADGDAWTPRPVEGLSTIERPRAIACGHYHSLLAPHEGGVWAWGRDSEGQASGETVPGRPSPRCPAPVPGLVDICGAPDDPVARLAAGAFLSIGVLASGRLVAWGQRTAHGHGVGANAAAGAAGALASVAPAHLTLPRGGPRGALAADGPTEARAAGVAAGWGHALAWGAGPDVGAVWGWGLASGGRLGAPVPPRGEAAWPGPAVVAAALPIDAHASPWAGAACGLDHSLLLTGGGTVLSLGDPRTCLHGQLGRDAGGAGGEGGGAVASAAAATAFPAGAVEPPLPACRAIACGLGHSLAVSHCGREVWAWGWGAAGQLGEPRPGPGEDDAPPDDARTPRRVPIPPLDRGVTVRSVAAGRGHSAALLSDGRLLTWGSRRAGRLGRGRALLSFGDDEGGAGWDAPGFVETPGRVVDLACGWDHTLIVVEIAG